MATKHFIAGILQTGSAELAFLPRAKGRGQTPDIKGLRALEGVTCIAAHDANGRMDDDLFELLCEDEAPAR